MVFRHISENINTAFIRSIENSNNVLTDISAESKRLIAEACKKVVDEYEYQPIKYGYSQQINSAMSGCSYSWYW